MAVTLTGAGGLFTRLGRVFGAMQLVNSQRGAAIGDAVDAIVADYDDAEALVDSIYSSLGSHRSASGGFLGALRSVAAATVVEMVRADKAQPDLSLRLALEELARQMESNAASVADAAVTATVTPLGTNVGDPEVVCSAKLPSGRVAERALAEDVVGVVTADGQVGGGAAAGRERIAFRGEYGVEPMSQDWPAGSGASATVTVVDPSVSEQGGTGNWLDNGDFADWDDASSSGTGEPDAWVVAEGSVGSTVLQESSSGFVEETALALVGDGATSVTLYQEFDSTSGSSVAMRPLDQLAVCLWVRVSGDPAAGVLRVALVDGDGTVIDDDEGTANSLSVDLTALSSSSASGYLPYSAAFRTPSVLPDVVRLQLRLTTPLSNGATALVDSVGLARMVPLYAGGPSLAAFRGFADAVKGDRFAVTIANDNTGGFQAWFDRAFGMRGLGLLLPSAGSPTISDGLISTS